MGAPLADESLAPTNVEPAHPVASTQGGECSESVVINSSTACGYSELGSSASACGRSYDELESQLRVAHGEVARLRLQLDRVLETEVALVLQNVIDEVVSLSVFSGVKKYYHKRTVDSKERIVAAYRKLKREDPDAPVQVLIAKLRQASHDADLSWRSIRRWSRQGPCKKRGRRVNEVFESRVLDSLVYASLDKVDSVEKCYVVANLCYGYDVVEEAARLVQKSPELAHDDKVQKLKFSNPWVVWWLRRRAMRRRRCTTQLKELPPPEVIQATMADIQKCIDDNKYETSQILSSDETAILFGLPPKNQYVPVDAGI